MRPEPGTVEMVVGSVMNHVQPPLSIDMSDAAGQSLDEAVAPRRGWR